MDDNKEQATPNSFWGWGSPQHREQLAIDNAVKGVTEKLVSDFVEDLRKDLKSWK